MSSQKPSKPENTLAPKQLDPNSDLPPDADIEERFNDFWTKNGTAIFGGIALAAVVVVGYQVMQYMGERAELAKKEAFRSAETVDQKIAFAEAHKDSPLAGFTWLELADAAFEEGDHTVAIDYYEQAQLALPTSSLFKHRALLGAAQAQLLAGNTDAALNQLELIAGDGSVSDTIRGEAAYTLAVAQWERGNWAAVEAAIEICTSLESAQFWAFRAGELQDRIPELAGN